MNAEGADRKDRVEAGLLPPVVTRKGSAGARPGQEIGLVPPFKVRPNPRPAPPPVTRVTAPPPPLPPPPSVEVVEPVREPEPVQETAAAETPEVFASIEKAPEPILEIVEFGAAIELPEELGAPADAFDTPGQSPVLEANAEQSLDLEMPWQDLVVEAASNPDTGSDQADELMEFFAGDIALSADADAEPTVLEEAIPFDAFLLTPEVEQIPAGPVTESPPMPALDQVLAVLPVHQELADRLERLSRRLRAEELSALLSSLAQGDHFDALMAGFLAGHVSARKS